MKPGIKPDKLSLISTNWWLFLPLRPPPLCGAVPADSNYICNKNDKIAARVKSAEGEENWILASVVSFNQQTNKYEVDDIDAEEGKE